MKILIQNGLVLLYDENGWRTEKQDVLIDGNRIERIGAVPETEDCRVIDAGGKLVMPGLINAQTHA